ncbi:MAG: DUF4386 family protein [Kordiimonadaceae bacterium]|nr:DUF4386 family protein [Kordiimonadaceae bacterium]
MIGAAFSSILVILVLSLHHLLKAVAPNVMQVASVFGFLWAGLVIAGSMIFNVGMATVIDLYGKDPEQAATVWLTISTIYEGLAGGNELVGGFWVFLVSWVGIRHQVFPKSLHMLGILVGVAGISSSLPGLGEIGGAVFGLGQIGWFLYLGGVMIRAGKASAK